MKGRRCGNNRGIQRLSGAVVESRRGREKMVRNYGINQKKGVCKNFFQKGGGLFRERVDDLR